MKESTILTEDDMALIGALQVAPRAPWTDIGEALEISGVTAARRWERISREGIAWITVAPGMVRTTQECRAYVEIDCLSSKRLEIAAQLARNELVMSVEITTGSADILLTVAAANLAILSHYLLDDLDKTENIVRMRAHIATKIYREGSAWRLIGFSGYTLKILERSRHELMTEVGNDGPVTMTIGMRRIAGQLAINGRATYTELAESTGISQTSVRRQVGKLLSSRSLLPRTDLAAEMSGSPIQAYLWADTPIETLSEFAHAVVKLRQVRLCATVSSNPNVVLCAWLHTVEEVQKLELVLTKRFPQLRIVDRLIVLRTIKRMGRLVDSRGRAGGVVPINIWDGFSMNLHDNGFEGIDN